MRVASIQIGLPRHRGSEDAADPMDRPWHSGFVKEPVSGPFRVGPEGVAGDGQADRVNHGGADKAVLGYASSHYPIWRRELALDAIGPGGFGENLTIDGLDESGVCVGDVYVVGDELTLEVSQPRMPCWKLGRRWRLKDLPARTMQTGRTGWYFRVIRPGIIEAGDVVVRVERPDPNLTLASLNDMAYGRSDVSDAAVNCPTLFGGWRAHLSALRDRAARRADRPPPQAGGAT